MKTLLVIDDDRTNLVSAKTALEDLYKVIAVTSAAQALKFFEKNTADLILLDLNMPEMDGMELFEILKKTENLKDIPVIFLTADSDASTETKCLESGAHDFISKPFVPIVMRTRISRTLELEDLRRSLATKRDQKIKEVDEMKDKSSKDALTGLWNRNYTQELVDKILSENGTGSLFMIDMDNFKAVNDTYGHQAGDSVLSKFAETMRKYAKEGDVLCRIGGDEFVTFVKDVTDKDTLGTHAQNIINDVVAFLKEAGYNTNSSVSIGIARNGIDGSEFNNLYSSADKALYFVKLNGKNSFHFFS